MDDGNFAFIVKSLALKRVATMQVMRNLTTSMRHAVRASALALALALAMGGLATAQDSEDNEWIDTKILREVLKGIGLRRDDKVIDYRERSPLVVPPNRALPPPQSNVAARSNLAWPKDPDVERARQARKQRTTQSLEEESRVLLPSELDKGRIRDGRQTVGTPGKDTWVERLLPSQLGYKGGLFTGSLFGKEQEVVPFKGEPPRVSLTQPPTGYLTPSPAHPYGLTANKKADKKPENSFLNRGDVNRSGH